MAAVGRTGRSLPNGTYFLRFAKSPHATIQFLDFATNKTIPIWTLEKELGIKPLPRRQIHCVRAERIRGIQPHAGKEFSLSTHVARTPWG
jgi:hypothetical protein